MKETRREREREHLRRLLSRGALSGRGAHASTSRTADGHARDARRRVLTGSVVAVAVAALVVTPQFLNKSRTTDMRRHVADATAGSAAVADPAVAPTSVTPCPDRPVPLPSGGRGEVPIRAEATSIRLCAAAIPGVDSDSVDAPGDALTTGTATFFRTLSALPPAEVQPCDAVRVAARPYVYLVGFSDGSVERVYVANSCDDVRVSGVRLPSDVVLRTYEHALEEQRSRAGTAGDR